MLGNTIAAISTPYGRGGVAMIRVSGDDALEICEKVFLPKSGKLLSEYAPRCSVYGDIVSNGAPIDDGIAVYYKAPSSYTGEDTVELCCHGGIRLSRAVLEALLVAGAKEAEGGEFTRRAFINGKLGLTEAEAVMNLIDAENDEQIRLASSHRRGVLSKEADRIYKSLLTLVSSTYAYIDYPDEDLTDIPPSELSQGLCKIRDELVSLENSYNTGKAVSEGITTAIVGRPNAGKSSLLNLILGKERAIVTDIAGTTRDVIEESVTIGHIMLRVSDTAGIRNASDTVERLGVERAYDKIATCELLLAVFDGSAPLTNDDKELISYIKRECVQKKTIAVINKTDAGICDECSDTLEHEFEHTIKMSAKDGEGKSELFELIEGFYISGDIDYDTRAIVANSRQYSAVRRARESVERAIFALSHGFTQDIAGMDIEQAMEAVGELDSRSVGEDVVRDIFGRFCVGK